MCRKLFLLLFVASSACYPIRVSPQGNHAPQGGVDTQNANEDAPPFNILVSDLLANDTDPDNDPISLEGDPFNESGGLANRINDQIVFTLDPEFSGTASFDYTLSDGLLTVPVTVLINVAPINDPPHANDKATSTDEDTAIDIDLSGSDIELDALTFSAVQNPSKGTLGAVTRINDTSAKIKYTPNPNQSGSDSFTFVANDGALNSTPATVSVTINPINDVPVAQPDSATANKGGPPIVINVLGNDADADQTPLTINTLFPPSRGTATLINNNTAISYLPPNNFAGPVLFSYNATDGVATSNTVNITVDVTDNSNCGDSVLNGGEECDDGNNIANDGCESNCSFTCGTTKNPDAVKTLGTSCYAFFRQQTQGQAFPVLWQDAEDFCVSLNGNLTAINDVAENTFLRTSLLAAQDVSWLGANDLTTEGTFVWTTAEPFLFQNFDVANNEPNDGNGNEDCLYMLTSGLWADTDCDNTVVAGVALVNGLICEVPLP